MKSADMSSFDFGALVRTTTRNTGTFVMVRPGVTLALTFPEPIQSLGPHVAHMVEMFLDFIALDGLNTYLSSNGWKRVGKNTLAKDRAELRSIPKRYEFVEYHYGQGEPANVGA
jgi:hypothetical protein